MNDSTWDIFEAIDLAETRLSYVLGSCRNPATGEYREEALVARVMDDMRRSITASLKEGQP